MHDTSEIKKKNLRKNWDTLLDKPIHFYYYHLHENTDILQKINTNY